MLQAITWASPPALRMPSAAASQASAVGLEITTLAPSFANSSAEERPMPRLEPVMTATLPVRSNGVDCLKMPVACPAMGEAKCGDGARVIPGCRFAHPGYNVCVMRGLDPRIHPLRKIL